MKLILGCGNKKFDGWTTLDINADVFPDIVHDLEQYPWPIEDNSAEEIICSHVIEHVIQQGNAAQFFSFFREMWRISKDGAVCLVVVPDALSEFAYADPWHKSFYTKNIFSFVSKKSIDMNSKIKSQATPCEIDFDFDIMALNIIDGDIHCRLKALK